MKVLIVANTHYQVLFAMQMKLTVFVNDEVSIIVTDHSKNMLYVSKRLEKINIFKNVKYVESKNVIYHPKRREKICDFISFSFLNINRF